MGEAGVGGGFEVEEIDIEVATLEVGSEGLGAGELEATG